MHQSSKLNWNYQLFANVIINLLPGLTIAFLSTLLIYFKQKAILHNTVILVSVFMVYFLSHIFRSRTGNKFNNYKAVAIIIFFVICILGAQFIYQIRPYTFYISGFAVGGILLLTISSTFLASGQSLKIVWRFPLFLAGYVIGFFFSPEILQFIIVGLALIVTGFNLITTTLNKIIKVSISGTIILVIMAFWQFYTPIIYYEEQADYEDKILFTAATQYHKLVITQWHEDYWYFIDKLKNLSSIDEYLYYEPMTHSIFKIAGNVEKILVIGGENGCLLREALKHNDLQRIDVISYDTLLRKLGEENQYYVSMNQHSYEHDKVHIIHKDLLQYISETKERYDAIFIDLPDPRSIETNRYYTIEFYNIIQNILNKEGIMITQAGSPLFATEAYYTIGHTIDEAGFHILPIHNQILTLGEWGWYICSLDLESDEMGKRLVEQRELTVETSWFNNEAASLISAFGKTYYDTLNLDINSLEHPLVYQYYLKGNWNLK